MLRNPSCLVILFPINNRLYNTLTLSYVIFLNLNSLISQTLEACMIFFFNGATAPSGPRPPHYRGFTITLRHTTVGGTPLDE
jgi:hypothetical protein